MPEGYGGPLVHEGHFSVDRDWKGASEVESVTIDGAEMIDRRVVECMAGTEGWVALIGYAYQGVDGDCLALVCDNGNGCNEVPVKILYGDVRVTMRPQPARR